LALRCVVLGEGELEGLELLISVKVALEVLEQHYFLVDRLRVAEEVEVRHEVCDTLCCLTIVVQRWLVLWALDVVKVELVGVQDDLCAVIEEHTVAAVREHIAEAILRAEVNKLNDELSAKLVFRRRHKQVVVECQCARWLNLGEFRC